MSLWKLSVFQNCTICVVNGLVVQKAVTSSRTSEAKWTTTNQASGGVRSSNGRNQGKRQKNPEKRTAPPPLGRGRLAASTDKSALDCGPGRYPLVVRNAALARSEERRVGKECRARWWQRQ